MDVRANKRTTLFSLADARGNNPHGTRETADHESRRINAERYETVEQLDHALDDRAGGLPPIHGHALVRHGPIAHEIAAEHARHRARLDALRRGLGAGPDAMPPPTPAGLPFWPTLLAVAFGAVVTYALTRDPKKAKDDDDVIDGELVQNPTLALPAPAPVPGPSPVLIAPVLGAAVNPAPPTVIVAPGRRRSRKSAKVTQETTTTTTTTVPEGSTITSGESKGALA